MGLRTERTAYVHASRSKELALATVVVHTHERMELFIADRYETAARTIRGMSRRGQGSQFIKTIC